MTGLLAALLAVATLVISAPAASGQVRAPTPPHSVPSTTLPPSGRVVTLANPSQLQAALDAAQPGDRIELDPSTVWKGNWTFRRPAAGARVILASSDPNRRPVLMTPNGQPVLQVKGKGVGGLHLVGLEITADPSFAPVGGPHEVLALVQLGEWWEPVENIGFERCLIRGNPNQQVRRGIAAHANNFFFIKGEIREIHRTGFDSQGIWAAGNISSHLIEDTFIEAASENIMYGDTPGVPKDITIRRVHLYKNPSWQQGQPGWLGVQWNVKNHLEFKSGQYVQVEGLVTENVWVEGQTGRSIVITPRGTSQDRSIVTQDIDIHHVRIINAQQPWVILGHDDGPSGTRTPETATARVRIRNVLGTGIQSGAGHYIADAYDIELDRITILGSKLYGLISGHFTRWKFTNAILEYGQGGIAVDQSWGTATWQSVVTQPEFGPILLVGPAATPNGPYGVPMPGDIRVERSGGSTDAALDRVFPKRGEGDYLPAPPYRGLGADPAALKAALASPGRAEDKSGPVPSPSGTGRGPAGPAK